MFRYVAMSVSSRFGGDAFLEKHLVLLSQTSTQMLKYTSGATAPKFRSFKLSDDLTGIQWTSPNKPSSVKTIDFKDVIEIKFGQQSGKFLRNHRPDLEHLSFSLYYSQSQLSHQSHLLRNYRRFRRRRH